MKERRRFHIQSDSFARSRINALKWVAESLMDTDSPLISVVLHGSLSKGTTRPESDIDAFFLIEPLEGEYFFPKAGTGIWEGVFLSTDMAIFTNDCEKQYREVILKRLTALLPDMQREQLKDVQVLPLNRAIVDHYIQNIRTHTLNGLHFSEVAAQVVEGEIPDANTSHSTVPVEYPSVGLQAMFHLEITGRAGEYRKYLLNALENLGEEGQHIWLEISRAIEAWQQNVSYKELPTAKEYPRTLTDAIQEYA